MIGSVREVKKSVMLKEMKMTEIISSTKCGTYSAKFAILPSFHVFVDRTVILRSHHMILFHRM